MICAERVAVEGRPASAGRGGGGASDYSRDDNNAMTAGGGKRRVAAGGARDAWRARAAVRAGEGLLTFWRCVRV